jgi:UDP-glucose 4-epimerase
MERVVVTGASGFVGSTLVDRLLLEGFEVVGLDNHKTGTPRNLISALKNKNFTFHKIDLKNEVRTLAMYLKNTKRVFHLSANADIRFGAEDPYRDFQQNTQVTMDLLGCMKENDVKEIVFASTGSIYGESHQIPTPENAPFPIQTSLYGASKLACEGLIQAFSSTYGFKSTIFRFVSILGPRYSHGHVIDFYHQLIANPKELKVLGNGFQTKSYLHVEDCIQGIIQGYTSQEKNLEIFNLGLNETCTVRDSIAWICKEMNLDPMVIYGTDLRGWIGDNPYIHLETSKIEGIGWRPKYSIEESVCSTIRYLKAN